MTLGRLVLRRIPPHLRANLAELLAPPFVHPRRRVQAGLVGDRVDQVADPRRAQPPAGQLIQIIGRPAVRPGRPDHRRHGAPDRRLDQAGLPGTPIRQQVGSTRPGVPVTRLVLLCDAEQRRRDRLGGQTSHGLSCQAASC